MKFKVLLLIVFAMVSCAVMGQDLKSKKVKKLITKKWYSTMRGTSEEDMKPSFKEEMEFKADGTVSMVQKGGMMAGEVMEATWEFHEETQKLAMTLEMMGQSQTVELDILILDNERLRLMKQGRVVEYGLEPHPEEEGE